MHFVILFTFLLHFILLLIFNILLWLCLAAAHNCGKFTVMLVDYFFIRPFVTDRIKPAEVGVHTRADRKWPFVFWGNTWWLSWHSLFWLPWHLFSWYLKSHLSHTFTFQELETQNVFPYLCFMYLLCSEMSLCFLCFPPLSFFFAHWGL